MLRGLELEGDSIPPRYLPNSDQEMIINTAYLHYHKQDDLLVV